METKDTIYVLYIITQLELGGAQKVCLSLLDQLPSDHVQTFLIAGPKGPLAQNAQKNPRVCLIPELQQESLLKTIRCFFILIKKIRMFKKKYPNIIVHTHSTTAGLIGRWAAFFAGVKIRIHTIHGYAFHEHCSYIQWIAIYFCELFTSLITTHFICVSSKDIQNGLRLFPFFKQKHSLIRASVDSTFFCAQKISHPVKQNKPFIFGTIACFKPQKNIFDLLNAFKKVYNQNNLARLEIIGDGILRPAIEKWIRTHDLTHVITLHGWQSSVAPYMQRWHAFTLTSLWEGLPCAIVEARLIGLPIITYDTGGITDIIFHGQNGLIYHQGEWKCFANGMLRIMQKPTLLSLLKHYNDQLEDFTVHYMTKQHYTLYKKITNL